MTIFDERCCQLGEGPLWHPERQQLFWFDILSKQLLSRENGQSRSWQFDRHVSAAGWVDRDRLLIASERDLFLFDLNSGTETSICPLEADNSITRSNDGRTDPHGGFWIGTMGKNAELQAGAIYRYYRGEVRCLFDKITISNAICFSPCGRKAYFTDTVTACVMQVALDQNGWSDSDPTLFADLSDQSLNPDGAVVDADGNVWIAQWGASRIAAYKPDGSYFHEETFPASQISCPAFGGPDLRTLFATSARDGLSDQEIGAGKTFARTVPFKGQREHQVIL
jgi:sugar lactone lactonase YvrE